MKTHTRYTLLLLAGLSLINLASAQTSRDWNHGRGGHAAYGYTATGMRATEHGQGTLGIKGPNRRLTLASVTLTRGGYAEFLFRGAQDYQFSGTWRRGRGNQALVTITHAFGRMRATGFGTVVLTHGGRSFSRIDISGTSASLGGDYNINFQTGDYRERGGENFSLDSTRRGQGSIGLRGPNIQINQARVLLQVDGDARITLYGRDIYVFKGTWAKQGRKLVLLTLTRGPDGRKINVAGTLRLTRNGFSRLTATGFAPSFGGQINLSFNASSRDHIGHEHHFRGRKMILHGSGTLGLRGPNIHLNYASVALYQNGQVILTFQGDRRYVMYGTWFGRRDRGALDFEIYQINNQPATGTGRISLHRNGEAHGVMCRGRSRATNGSFTISFQPEGH